MGFGYSHWPNGYPALPSIKHRQKEQSIRKGKRPRHGGLHMLPLFWFVKPEKNHVCIHIYIYICIYIYIYKLYPYSFTYILSWYKYIHHINVYIILYNQRIIYKYIYIGSCLKQQISQLHIFSQCPYIMGVRNMNEDLSLQINQKPNSWEKNVKPVKPQQIEQNSRKWCSIVLEIAGLVCING